MAGPPIDKALVLHVAKLASLSLSDEEVDRCTNELARVLAYVEQLESLDTRDVPPTAHGDIARLPLRSDAVAPCLARDEVLAQAPQSDADGFAVPAFVE
jgi:aspartyl-tRNA(Asn)/glutamyl-tRNA(Gln) amidotransferase subunit C